MNKVLNLALVSGALFLSGSATQQVAQIAPLETSRTLPYSKDKVWASTVKIVSQKLKLNLKPYSF